MAKDYAAITKKIVENIGGVENIASVTHCMTRLRFVVKDEGKINDAAVKATDGVMGVVNQGGQYQIIIGNHVEEAYNEVLKMGDFGEASQVARGEKKEPLTLKKVGNNILDAVVGTMSPLIPAIITGGLILGFRNCIDSIYFFNNGTQTLCDISQFWSGVDSFLWLIGEAIFLSLIHI